MADEITAGPSSQSGDIALLFLYKSGITPRTYDDADSVEQTVVPTPSSGLPTWAVELLTTAEKAALDDGSMAFETGEVRQTEGMTGGDLTTAAQAIYDTAKAAYLVTYDVKFHEFYGARIDEA